MAPALNQQCQTGAGIPAKNDVQTNACADESARWHQCFILPYAALPPPGPIRTPIHPEADRNTRAGCTWRQSLEGA